VIDARESVSSEPSALDLEAIRARHFAPKGRLPNSWKTYEDVKALIAEVERLRPQIGVFGLSRWQQKVLIEQVDLVRAQVEAAHAEAATMRAWAEEAAAAENANAEDARKERAAVVATLRRTSNHVVDLDSIADAIERGEHRREEEK
jgi:hypothetical protein